MYHRQILKQFLTDKILKDPKQRQTFHMKDLYDLFTLGSSDGTTETGELFKGAEVQLNAPNESVGAGSNRRKRIVTPIFNGAGDGSPQNTIKFTAHKVEKRAQDKDDGEVLNINGV